ncbi:arylformamidase [Falsibacillus pallidus]|uniref:Kynurenine formamidase n=1 Tax=Falsibacillus pallidus TaxID=493781 RepID=A0A370GGE8_9BACI|nr:arylformamidase [Falsibacillus pallidus]RDI42306.1 kynurenine formamidase [Falsibacillus pallidus]
MKIIDISQRLHNQIPVWPGDAPFTFGLSWTKEDSGSVNVGKIEMSAHTGTHIDAPYHFDDEGARVADLPLERFIGKALVVDLTGAAVISKEELSKFDFSGVSKVLIKTGSWTDRSKFPETITSVHENTAPFLKEKGIDLIGVDVPSVDELDSKGLPSHHSLQRYDIQILEGIVLDGVEPGVYNLIALPLPLAEADGCPVRAVLIQE